MLFHLTLHVRTFNWNARDSEWNLWDAKTVRNSPSNHPTQLESVIYHTNKTLHTILSSLALHELLVCSYTEDFFKSENFVLG